ncbi:hypothetical protein OYE22_25110 [Streptomyces sp. 71268]|uniref:hypothetical protein n=1 Tax=Streptomyces sp. 71268 TaxID=3002640 RepID=UPI0023F6B35D|nr:hypothetical protein [Streptomyces sp. 71268]WEV28092.1 hypothetical protein OYE22_25110 [Streptomyces sp. 71268]
MDLTTALAMSKAERQSAIERIERGRERGRALIQNARPGPYADGLLAAHEYDLAVVTALRLIDALAVSGREAAAAIWPQTPPRSAYLTAT